MRPAPLIVALLLCSGSSALAPAARSFRDGDLRAQTARGLDLASSVAVRQGDDLHVQLKPLEALEVFRGVIEKRPDHYGALWRAAREAVSLGMLTSNLDDRRTWYRSGESYARGAIAAAPQGWEGHHWLAVALGRRALDEGVTEKVKLAPEIRSEAMMVLARDSLNAGAHHVLGHWHAEVMRVRGITRFLATKLLGAEILEEASWEKARYHLERAVELQPEALVHHLELAHLYLDLDLADEARRELRDVLERPALEPTDAIHKQRAQELLRKQP